MTTPKKHAEQIEKNVKWAEKQQAKAMTKKERKEYVESQELGGDALTNKPPEVFTNKVGRPTKYEFEKTCRQVKLLASKGFTDVEISEALDVSEQTLNTWKTEHPEFLESIKEGKALIDDMVEKSLLNRAMGCAIKETKVSVTKDGDVIETEIDKHFPPDPTSMIFWLKNRRPAEWRDKREVDFTSPLTIEMSEADQNTL